MKYIETTMSLEADRNMELYSCICCIYLVCRKITSGNFIILCSLKNKRTLKPRLEHSVRLDSGSLGQFYAIKWNQCVLCIHGTF